MMPLPTEPADAPPSPSRKVLPSGRDDADGKVIHLSFHDRVLFLERAMEETLDRQQVRHAQSWPTGRGIPALSVSYADLVHRPDQALPPLAAFLGVPDRLAAMRGVIDPSLHRARGAGPLAGTPFSPSPNPEDGA